jgi:hypothetical protein
MEGARTLNAAWHRRGFFYHYEFSRLGTGAGGRCTDIGTDDGGGYFEGHSNNKLKPTWEGVGFSHYQVLIS